MTIPLILDVDTGVDDAFALMLAARHPDVELKAVSCVAGNAAVEQVVANTCYVLDTAGATEVPVARGAARPLLAPAHDAAHVHGRDGLGGFSRPSDRRVCPMPAVDLLRTTLTEAIATGDRITLVPLAPLTNIALLLHSYPQAAAGIERIVFMGGSAGGGNATAAAEFNVWHDPEAAAMVLTACADLEIPLTMYGLDVFGDVTVDGADAVRLRDHPDAAAQLAGALIEHQREVRGSDAVTIGDAGAVCAVIAPDGLRTARHAVRIDTGHGPGRGQTIVDRRTWSGDRAAEGGPADTASARVALGVDAAGYRELWLGAIAR